ncbi:MAG: NUDIX hydrolase [Actinomycetota bacterium]
MGAGALFRDSLDRLLLMKPTYKAGWEIPGGAIEVGESPRSCCRRELLEELGLETSIGRLLVFDWLPVNPPRPDGWMFVFDGGVLPESSTSRIVLQREELEDWRFVEVSELDGFLPAHRARRVRVAHACALSGSSADLEWGHSVEVGLEFAAVEE